MMSSMSVQELIVMLKDKTKANQAFQALLAKGKSALAEIETAYKTEEDEDARYWLLKLKRQLSK